MTIQEKANEIVDEFSIFEDWMDKYNYLIDMGKEMEPMEEESKTKQNLISGCQSQLWLTAKYDKGKIYLKADSDAIITKGIANVLIRVLNGETPDIILNYDLSFLDKIGLQEHLSPTRSNGLVSMIRQIKLYAVVFKSKYEQI